MWQREELHAQLRNVSLENSRHVDRIRVLERSALASTRQDQSMQAGGAQVSGHDKPCLNADEFSAGMERQQGHRELVWSPESNPSQILSADFSADGTADASGDGSRMNTNAAWKSGGHEGEESSAYTPIRQQRLNVTWVDQSGILEHGRGSSATPPALSHNGVKKSVGVNNDEGVRSSPLTLHPSPIVMSSQQSPERNERARPHRFPAILDEGDPQKDTNRAWLVHAPFSPGLACSPSPVPTYEDQERERSLCESNILKDHDFSRFGGPRVGRSVENDGKISFSKYLSLVEDEERETLEAGDASAALQELEYDTRHLRERLSIVVRVRTSADCRTYVNCCMLSS